MDNGSSNPLSLIHSFMRMRQDRQTISLTCCSNGSTISKDFVDCLEGLDSDNYINYISQASKIILEILICANFSGITSLAEI